MQPSTDRYLGERGYTHSILRVSREFASSKMEKERDQIKGLA